ncbi:MAG: transcriptional regulator [Boseongicola sp. SB0664_bin_43]|uniref:Transcriptional regulator n=1 Tax=Boseongicola sp. SB0664_bin_43 TaxID=2604844 RepID=A0A6B0XWD2_9RHOB|nr:transcriptional regulator [Boseongicola sp. SB0664_bin_43]MYG83676.1 transcriptional regulator [Gemmatimonadota bacterium]
MSTLTDRMDKLPLARRNKIEERARELIAEEMSLRDLRKARKQTQVRVAEALGINQENVSRLERRSDRLISTLSDCVEAMGGKLSLVVEFPDRRPVALTGIAALDDLSERHVEGASRSPS